MPFYQFIIDEHDKNASETATELAGFFEGSGIKLIYNESAKCLTFNIDTPEYNKKKSRGAGRKRNCTTDYIEYTYADIYQWREQGIPMNEIAKTLGTSRATLYRRLQEVEEWNWDLNASWMG